MGKAGWAVDDADPRPNKPTPTALPLGKAPLAWIELGSGAVARELGSRGFNTLATTPTLDINTRAPTARNNVRAGGRVDWLDGTNVGELSEPANNGTGGAASVPGCSSPSLGIRRSWSDFVTSSRKPIGNFRPCRSTSLVTRAESWG